MKIIIVFLFLTISIGAQEYVYLSRINEYFKNFEYEKVITLSDSIINNKLVDQYKLANIYVNKGIAHYYLMEDRLAEESFQRALYHNYDVKLDPVLVSPKVQEYFMQIKSNYKKIENEKSYAILNPKKQLNHIRINDFINRRQQTIFRSLLFPGLGHIYKGEVNKGVILASLGTISLGSFIYFSFETGSKEEKYFTERNVNQLDNRFSDYEKTKKIRNYSLAAFLGLWLFSQADILLFNNEYINLKEDGVDFKVYF